MKASIKWHEGILTNLRSSLVRKIEEANRIAKEVQDLRNDIDLLTYQIDVALQKGLTEFDRDKFCIPRKKKPQPEVTPCP